MNENLYDSESFTGKARRSSENEQFWYLMILGMFWLFSWSGKLSGYKRFLFIINCLTRMRMITADQRLNFTHNSSPWRARKNLQPWYAVDNPATGKTRVVFGHWSQLGLIVMPGLISLDTGCIWGRQLTAVRLDKRLPRVFQVQGQS